MVVPIKTGNSIIPIYIPQPVSTNSGLLQQINTDTPDTQNNEPTLVTWIGLGVVLIFIIACTVYFIKFMKENNGK